MTKHQQGISLMGCLVALALGPLPSGAEAQIFGGGSPEHSSLLVQFMPLILLLAAIVYFSICLGRQLGRQRMMEKLFEKGKAVGNGIIIKTYRGSEPEAIALFEVDAVEMASKDYFSTSQSWAAGQWGASAYVIAVLLIFLFGLGILILAYMVIVKPPGTLTVTYELRAKHDEKICPMCAERIKAAALVCHFCGHQFKSKSLGPRKEKQHAMRPS